MHITPIKSNKFNTNNRPNSSFQGAYKIRVRKDLFGPEKNDEELVQNLFLAAVYRILHKDTPDKNIMINFQSSGYEYLKQILEYKPGVDFNWLKAHFSLMLKPGAPIQEKLVLPEENYYTFSILTNEDMETFSKATSVFGELKATFRSMMFGRYFKPNGDSFIQGKIIDSIVDNETFDRITAGHLKSFDVTSVDDFYKAIQQIGSEL